MIPSSGVKKLLEESVSRESGNGIFMNASSTVIGERKDTYDQGIGLSPPTGHSLSNFRITSQAVSLNAVRTVVA